MPALSFAKRFADDVESGKKRQTIRVERKRPVNPGDPLYLYTGMRTKACRKLGESECDEVHRFRREGRGKWWLIEVENRWGLMERGEYLGESDIAMMARLDGFDTTAEFEDWFDQYPDGSRLDLLKWGNFS